MSTDSGDPIDAQPILDDPPADSDRGTDPDNTDPTPGSDDPVSD